MNSKVSVKLTDLRRALRQTKGTIATQDVQVLLRNYLITGDAKKGRLSLLSTDTDLASVGVCEAEVSDDFCIAIPGIKLAKIADYTSAEVLILHIENQKMIVMCGGFSCELQGLPPDDFPKFPDLDELNFSEVSREILLSQLRRISFSINENPVKKNLLAVRIADGYMLASDGKVTTMCTCALSGKLVALTIPKMAVQDLLSVLAASENPEVAISDTSAFIVFKLGESRFLARKSQAKFPDVFKIISKPTESISTKVNLERDSFWAAVRRVSVAADERSLCITLTFTEVTVKISANDLAGNKAIETVPCSWNGEVGVSYNFNFSYLLDIMESLSSQTVSVKISSNMRLPIRFDDGDFSAFLMRRLK